MRAQGDPVRELAAVTRGFCPDDRAKLVPLYPGGRNCPRRCGVCGLAWETGRNADGVPGYGYRAGGHRHWYHVHSLRRDP